MKKNNGLNGFIEKKLPITIIAILLIIVFVLSLIPLFAIAFYNRPAADDYSFGILTVHTWRETKSIFQTILTAFAQVKKTYIDWQGTFSAVFLFALQPGIFGEQYYFLTTFLILGSFIAANFYFLFVICKYYIKTDYSSWIILSICILMTSIQLVFSARESFYWYNGSIYYTFYYSVFLVLIGMLLKIGKKGRATLISWITIGLLSLFIGGGNYTTALVGAIVLFCLASLVTFQKNPIKSVTWLAFFLLIIGLGISAAAPGNAVRAASPDIVPMSPPKAICYSFYYAIKKIGEWTNLLFITVLVSVVPLMWRIAKQSSFSFRYPAFAVLFSFCIFAAQMTPPLYAIGSIGAERQIDIYYYAFVLLTFLNLFYCIGWLEKQMEWKAKREPGYSIPFLFMIVLFLWGGAINANYKSMSSISAFESIRTGKAQAYAADLDERLAMYHDPSVKAVVVKPLRVIPGVLKPDSVQRDATNWQNEAIADFYDKDSVSLME